jgi:hypothetical protein
METKMREDKHAVEHDDLVDLGAATELTQGSYLPGATEAVTIKDHWDEP